MLRRSALFRPSIEVNPKWEHVCQVLLAHDRFANFSMDHVLKFDPTAVRTVLHKDPSSGVEKSALMLFPFTVESGATNVFGTTHGGLLMTLLDMFSSLHICERLLPGTNGHVSVNLNMNFIAAAKKGDKVVGVTKVGKQGKRLVYTDVDFLLDVPEPVGAPGKSPTTLRELEEMLKEYPRIASGSHVKSILSNVHLK